MLEREKILNISSFDVDSQRLHDIIEPYDTYINISLLVAGLTKWQPWITDCNLATMKIAVKKREYMNLEPTELLDEPTRKENLQKADDILFAETSIQNMQLARAARPKQSDKLLFSIGDKMKSTIISLNIQTTGDVFVKTSIQTISQSSSPTG